MPIWGKAGRSDLQEVLDHEILREALSLINDQRRKKTEKKHHTHAIKGAGEFYIALNDCNLAFQDEELDVVREMWREGRPVDDIANTLQRPDIEVGALVMDLGERSKLKSRPGGALGEDWG